MFEFDFRQGPPSDLREPFHNISTPDISKDHSGICADFHIRFEVKVLSADLPNLTQLFWRSRSAGRAKYRRISMRDARSYSEACCATAKLPHFCWSARIASPIRLDSRGYRPRVLVHAALPSYDGSPRPSLDTGRVDRRHLPTD